MLFDASEGSVDSGSQKLNQGYYLKFYLILFSHQDT